MDSYGVRTTLTEGFGFGLRLDATALFPHKQRQRGRKSVQKISSADRTDLAIAKETRKSQRTQLSLNRRGVMVGLSK